METTILQAQNDCDLNSFNIEETYFNEDIVAYYLGSIDINTGSSNLLLFDYLIYSTNQFCYSMPEVDLFLHFSISIYSPQLGFNEFQEFLTSTFKFSDIIAPIRFKNTDMDFSTNTIPGANINRLEYNIGGESNDKDVQTIINIIMQSGKIPNGLYIFHAKLTADEPGVDIIDQISRQIDVYEPEYINLLTPGGSLSDTLGTVVYTPYPIFSWESDNCTSSNCNVGIRVCEFNPNYHSNLSDAMQSNSLIPINQSVEYFELEPMGTSYQYPILDVESLQPGKLYAWQLHRSFVTTVGVESLFSDIFVFKLHSFEGNITATTENMEVIKGILGEDHYRNFFGSNGELRAYTSEISTISIDGQEITISLLYEFLSKVEQNKINIVEVKSE